MHAGDESKEELQNALRPLASLASKSEKALHKLAPGTWQHQMLRDNLQALRIALALVSGETNRTADCSRDELQKVLLALASMISKTEKSKDRFFSGTAQHSLQRNRLNALRIAESRIKAELD